MVVSPRGVAGAHAAPRAGVGPLGDTEHVLTPPLYMVVRTVLGTFLRVNHATRIIVQVRSHVEIHR